jgi:citrate synthase
MEQMKEFESDMLKRLGEKIKVTDRIDPELYTRYQVKRGLRDIDGRGVLVGLTEIGEVRSYIVEAEEMVPIPGKLIYRGIDINDIVNGYLKDERFGFEETCYLLLFGNLPSQAELVDFERLLSEGHHEFNGEKRIGSIHAG